LAVGDREFEHILGILTSISHTARFDTTMQLAINSGHAMLTRTHPIGVWRHDNTSTVDISNRMSATALGQLSEGPTILHVLDSTLFRDLGQTLEGDIFQTLKESPHVIRAWEFALADGAIDVTRMRRVGMNYAERLWDLLSYGPESKRSELVLFDVKSSSAVDDCNLSFISTEAQRLRVAFYLCISATDPGWVDLMPNYRQDASKLRSGGEDRGDADEGDKERFNVHRASRLPDAAHGSLHPCNTPYRMPIRILPEALSRVRSRVVDGTEFVNPWTGVAYRDWIPLTTPHASYLKPSEQNPQYTAFEEAWDVFAAARENGRLQFDMIGLQPMLADFKLTATSNGRFTQSTVQAKSEGRERGANSKLTRVSVLRKERYSFEAKDR
jgi:hypothetical protein